VKYAHHGRVVVAIARLPEALLRTGQGNVGSRRSPAAASANDVRIASHRHHSRRGRGAGDILTGLPERDRLARVSVVSGLQLIDAIMFAVNLRVVEVAGEIGGCA